MPHATIMQRLEGEAGRRGVEHHSLGRVVEDPRRIAATGGGDRGRPATAGGRPARRRHRARVSCGSSARAVPLPTMIASTIARSRCASWREIAEEIQREVPSSGRDSPVQGAGELPGDERTAGGDRVQPRPQRAARRPRRLRARRAPRGRPGAAARRRRPRPDSGRRRRTRPGRRRPRCTRRRTGRAAGVRARFEGDDAGCRRAAAGPASSSATRSACGRRPAASPRLRRARRPASSTTAPTGGFGLVRPRTESANVIACRMASCSRSVDGCVRVAGHCGGRPIAGRARGPQRLDRAGGFVGAVDRRAGDEHIGAGLGGGLDRVEVDAAVDLDEQPQVPGVRRARGPGATFGSTSAMNCWPPKPGSTVITSSVSNSRSTSR